MKKQTKKLEAVSVDELDGVVGGMGNPWTTFLGGFNPQNWFGSSTPTQWTSSQQSEPSSSWSNSSSSFSGNGSGAAPEAAFDAQHYNDSLGGSGGWDTGGSSSGWGDSGGGFDDY